MAMEKVYVKRDTHTRSITALGYNPARREILIGCEGKVEHGCHLVLMPDALSHILENSSTAKL